MHLFTHRRTKSLYSTMRKLLALQDSGRSGRRREDLYDLLGLRIIVAPRAAGVGGEALAEEDAVQVAQVGVLLARCQHWSQCLCFHAFVSTGTCFHMFVFICASFPPVSSHTTYIDTGVL